METRHRKHNKTYVKTQLMQRRFLKARLLLSHDSLSTTSYDCVYIIGIKRHDFVSLYVACWLLRAIYGVLWLVYLCCASHFLAFTYCHCYVFSKCFPLYRYAIFRYVVCRHAANLARTNTNHVIEPFGDVRVANRFYRHPFGSRCPLRYYLAKNTTTQWRVTVY